MATRAATRPLIIGGIVLLLFIIGLLVGLGRQPTGQRTLTPLDRAIATDLEGFKVAYDLVWLEGNTLYARGHYLGLESEKPKDSAGWEELANGVAEAVARNVQGSGLTVDVTLFNGDVQLAHATAAAAIK